MTKSEIIRYELALFIVLLPSLYYQRYWMAIFNDMFTRARVPLQELPGCEVYQLSEYRGRA